MKTFLQYLSESKKQFKYTIKLAFKPDNETVDKIEHALEKFDLDSLSKPKSLPIKKADPHFPKITSPETYSMDVVVNYPATVEFIRQAISQIGMDLEQVCVVGEHFDEVNRKEQENRDKNLRDQPLLMRELENLSDVPVAELSGDDYNKKLVKNSVSGKVKVPTPAPAADTTNNYATGNKSAIGSTKNKLPNVTSSAR